MFLGAEVNSSKKINQPDLPFGTGVSSKGKISKGTNSALSLLKRGKPLH